MTQQSLARSRSAPSWIDEAFLWTATSLAVIAITAAAPAPSLWTGPLNAGARSAPAPGPLPGLRLGRSSPSSASPRPLISFADPVPGYRIISPFGLRQLPWEERGRLHQGVDIAAPSGAPVLAAAAGVVLRTGVDDGYGRFIELRHAGGLTSLYGHLSAIGVHPGAPVPAGAPVGRIGSTGSSTGSHLHFEIHDGEDRPLNPALFLGRAFYDTAELPIRAALRAPRGVRLAFVSFIPRARREQMAEREAEKAALEAQAAVAETERQQPRTDQATLRLASVQTQGPAAAQVIAPAATPAPAVPAAAPVRERVVLAPLIVDMTQPKAKGRVHGRIVTGASE